MQIGDWMRVDLIGEVVGIRKDPLGRTLYKIKADSANDAEVEDKFLSPLEPDPTVESNSSSEKWNVHGH